MNNGKTIKDWLTAMPVFAALAAPVVFCGYEWSAARWLPSFIVAAFALSGVFRGWKFVTDRTVLAALALLVWCCLVDAFHGTFSACNAAWWAVMLLYFLQVRRSGIDGHTAGRIVAVLTVIVALHLSATAAGIIRHPLFGNSSGYAAVLAIGLPFVLAQRQDVGHAKRHSNLLFFILLLPVVAALLLTASRAAVLAVLLSAACFPICTGKIRLRRHLPWVVLATIAVALLVYGLYRLRPASADGRLLIYRVVAGCIAQSPVAGHGTYGLLHDYMPAQAAHLSSCPDDAVSTLAGNVTFCFNEALAFTLCYGLVGTLLLSTAIFFALRRRHAAAEESAAFRCSMVAAFAVSMLSYPFAHPAIVLLLVFLVGAHGASSQKSRSLSLKLPVAAVSLFIVVAVFCRVQGEALWHKARTETSQKRPQKAFENYAKALARLSHDPVFLYNYAAELTAAGRYEKSDSVLALCTRFLNDYDTECLAAVNAFSQSSHADAERHFLAAAAMIPSRFRPYDSLMMLYEQRGDTARRLRVARHVLQMNVKVPSDEVDEIREEAARILRDYKPFK